ncbi:MAG: T9SS type A sorting domain-containing protein [Saprospiraceae bacterium]|nr:T9SS type A sorting domain-containing protein [Saprospiraceae bacterium]
MKGKTNYYRLSQTDFNGKKVIFFKNIEAVSVPSINSNSFIVYPNPTDGEIIIETMNPKKQIEIYNQIGQLIQIIESEERLTKVLINKGSSGIYFVKFENDKRVVVVK